ncbi:chalcone isomerase family protein [Kangiella shandongensis]|uniref:chalcone isomerase family protein n=1 Tax=Kangiella shandongensis TaxID=2763258 RepID=UPI001CC09C6B|nr:chalcone isomerase family protein [Kangiella shandongensis]
MIRYLLGMGMGLALSLLTTSAVSIADIPQEVSYRDLKLTLCAQEKITKGIFFDIVNVGIYYQDCSANQGIFDDQTKLLRFAYLREVNGEQFTEGAIEYLEENLTKQQQSQCMTEFKELNNSYKDVQNGDFYDLYLLYNQGIKLYLNQEYIIDMPNRACDSLYLNVWFGPESMDSQFEDLHKKLKALQED